MRTIWLDFYRTAHFNAYALHWAIESMHWDLGKTAAERAAGNLDTIQRAVLALIAVWKNKRKKYQISEKVRLR